MQSKHRFLPLLICVVSLPLSLNAAATIVIVNGDPPNVGFNDPAPAVPVGGNPGTTLGQQRMNVFVEAASKWATTLTSAVPIRVDSKWRALSCTENSAVLGSARATAVFRDFTNAPVGGHWYGKALANKFAGIDLAPNLADIEAEFNVNLGNSGCLTGNFFYLGLDNNHGSNVDLYTVVLHELAHGLGFQTYTDGGTGAFLNNFPSIWDDFILDNSTNKTWTEMTPAERVASATNTSHLVWNGGAVTSNVPLVLQPGGGSFIGADPMGRARLYAPGSFQSGSSVSHYDTVLSPNQLMEPSINSNLVHEVTPPSDLTAALFEDIGWIPIQKRRRGQVTSQD